MSSVKGSGDGMRPTTSGGIDNIGAGEKFVTEKTAAGGDISAPAPEEGMRYKRSDVEGTKHDDSAAYNLHEDLTPDSSKDDRSGDAGKGATKGA